jgi:hypothetical protein
MPAGRGLHLDGSGLTSGGSPRNHVHTEALREALTKGGLPGGCPPSLDSLLRPPQDTDGASRSRAVCGISFPCRGTARGDANGKCPRRIRHLRALQSCRHLVQEPGAPAFCEAGAFSEGPSRAAAHRMPAGAF